MRSVKDTNLWGDEIITHYDDHGNRIGETKFTTDMSGDKVAEHFDAKGNRIGSSKAYTDFWGDEKVEHRDIHGYRTGESQTYTDFWGNLRTEHRDAYGNVIGESQNYTDFLGGDYTETKYNEKDSDSSPAFNGSSGYGGTSSAGVPGNPGVGDVAAGAFLTILGIPLFIILIVLPLVGFWKMNQNGMESTAVIRSIIIGLCPLVTLISIVRFHGKKTDTPATRTQYRKFIFLTSMLFLVLEICFMLYTEPIGDGESKSNFVIFALCWVPKLIYSIIMGVWGRKIENADVKNRCYSVHGFASKAFSATTAIMEITNGITEGAYADVFNLILLLIPSMLILGGVITFFSFITNWLFKKIAGKPQN